MIVTFVSLYAIVSFIKLEIDFRCWTETTRVTYAILSIVFSVAIVGTYEGIHNKE